MGGFECATHRRNEGRRLDLSAATGHDVNAKVDYQVMADYGIRTVRDGIRWHLIETLPASMTGPVFSRCSGPPGALARR
jgi:hypothetical protein